MSKRINIGFDTITKLIDEVKRDGKSSALVAMFLGAFIAWQSSENSLHFWAMIVIGIPMTISVVIANIKSWKQNAKKEDVTYKKLQFVGDHEKDIGKHYYQMDFLNRTNGLLRDVIKISMKGMRRMKAKMKDNIITSEAFAIFIEQGFEDVDEIYELLHINVGLVTNPFDEFIVKARGLYKDPPKSITDKEEILKILQQEDILQDDIEDIADIITENIKVAPAPKTVSDMVQAASDPPKKPILEDVEDDLLEKSYSKFNR